MFIAKEPQTSGVYVSIHLRGLFEPIKKKKRTCKIVLRDEHGFFWCTSARLDRDRDGLFVFFVGVILFSVAAAVYFLAHLLVAAAPVVMLASFITISCVTPYASRRVVGQWGGAGGAICEDHFALAGRL